MKSACSRHPDCSSSGRAWSWLDNPVFRWAGVHSYGIYLSHILVIRELRPWGEDLGGAAEAFLLTGVATLALASLLSALSWRFLEKPCLQRRVPWRTAEPPPQTGPAVAAEADTAKAPA